MDGIDCPRLTPARVMEPHECRIIKLSQAVSIISVCVITGSGYRQWRRNRTDRARTLVRLAKESVADLLVFEATAFTSLPLSVKELAAPFRSSWPELPVLRYSGCLDSTDILLVNAHIRHTGTSANAMARRLRSELECELAWAVAAALFVSQYSTGRLIVCPPSLVNRIDSLVPCWTLQCQGTGGRWRSRLW